MNSKLRFSLMLKEVFLDINKRFPAVRIYYRLRMYMLNDDCQESFGSVVRNDSEKHFFRLCLYPPKTYEPSTAHPELYFLFPNLLSSISTTWLWLPIFFFSFFLYLSKISTNISAEIKPVNKGVLRSNLKFMHCRLLRYAINPEIPVPVYEKKNIF